MSKIAISNLASENNISELDLLVQEQVIGGSLIFPPSDIFPEGAYTIPLDVEITYVDPIVKYDTRLDFAPRSGKSNL
ncbi:MAG: hypothetical protein QNJ53_20235 [Pleurocapsa sp. MO_192.B19]|nr:hypothetical protein [Pleurocapsa sp. MO_192.B19]